MLWLLHCAPPAQSMRVNACNLKQHVSIAPPLFDLSPVSIPLSLHPSCFLLTLLLYFFLFPSYPLSFHSSFLSSSIFLPSFSVLPPPQTFLLPFTSISLFSHQMYWCNNSVLPLYVASTRMETMTFEWTLPWWVGLASREYYNSWGEMEWEDNTNSEWRDGMRR